MSRRWNANSVLLAVFVLILVGAGVDYGRRVLGGTKPPAPVVSPRGASLPDFETGDLAPDFALPDSKKRVRKLSELVTGKTVLFFACGCSNCKQVQGWLAAMRKQKKSTVPHVITVTSSPPESEQAWLRDTELEQTMLFWREGVTPDPMTIYKGKPCPRLYVLNADRTVKFIGSSMNEMPGTQGIGMEIARELDGKMPGGADGMARMMESRQKGAVQGPRPRPELPPYARPQSALPGAENQ